MELDLPEWWNW